MPPAARVTVQVPETVKTMGGVVPPLVTPIVGSGTQDVMEAAVDEPSVLMTVVWESASATFRGREFRPRY
jgi:hypothetical protein